MDPMDILPHKPLGKFPTRTKYRLCGPQRCDTLGQGAEGCFSKPEKTTQIGQVDGKMVDFQAFFDIF